MKNQEAVLADYEQQIKSLEIKIKDLKTTVDKYSIARLILFALGILLIYIFFGYGIIVPILTVLATIAVFLVLVKKQYTYQEELDFNKTQLMLVQNEIAVLTNYQTIYNNGAQFINPKHTYADDLDVFGVKSVFSYINRTASLIAENKLAKWLLAPADKNEILERQKAVEELSFYSRETLNFRTNLFPLDKEQLSKLEFSLNHLSSNLAFLNKKTLALLSKLLPIITVFLFIAACVWGNLLWNFLGLLLLFNATFYFSFKKHIDNVHESIGKASLLLKSYAKNLKWIEDTNWKSNYIETRIAAIEAKSPLSLQIKSLEKIITDLNYRYNPIIGSILNLFLLWDFKCLRKLNKWDNTNNEQILNSFNLIAEFEVLISFSVLSNNHPEWIFPEIKTDFGFEGEELGHPLIAIQQRVNNNFNLLNHPTADVITGSNMAGKSTFLRTVGVNMILAFAGAKVCATKFSSSVFNLYSYMRIKDSLIDQTSTFKAEIDRLKMILEETVEDKNALVLVDEMLRGTNSKDKYLGSKAFIERLIEQNTPGFIATHDLQIADLEQTFPDNVRNYHFDITMNNEEMYFDYKIKQGPCKTFNAAILLRAIGLKFDSNDI